MRQWFRGEIFNFTELGVHTAPRYDAVVFSTFPAEYALAFLGGQLPPNQTYLGLLHQPNPLIPSLPGLEDEAVRSMLRTLGSRFQLSVQGPRSQDAMRAVLMRHDIAQHRDVGLYVSLPPLLPEFEAAVEDAAAGVVPTRHICIQGKLDSTRRNYALVFAAAAAIRSKLSATAQRLLVIGREQDVELPPELGDVVQGMHDLPYKVWQRAWRTGWICGTIDPGAAQGWAARRAAVNRWPAVTQPNALSALRRSFSPLWPAARRS